MYIEREEANTKKEEVCNREWYEMVVSVSEKNVED